MRKLTAAALVCCLALSASSAQAPAKSKQPDGWITGAIFFGGSVGTGTAANGGSPRAGWVHVLSLGGKTLALRDVPTGKFRIEMPAGDYKVFASSSRAANSVGCQSWRVAVHPGQSTEIKPEWGCAEE